MNKDEQLLFDTISNNSPDKFNKVINDLENSFVLRNLSHMRANLISWISLPEKAKVLEIDSGYGAMTPHILSISNSVDCVESRSACVDIARKRLASEGLVDKVKFYDTFDAVNNSNMIYDAIFMINPEYTSTEQLEDTLRLAMLLAKRNTLKCPIYLAIENKYGLKYWAGNTDRYTGEFYSGIEGYINHKGYISFAKSTVDKIISKVGFTEDKVEYYYPYPDYEFPISIYSNERLPRIGELATNLRNFDSERFLMFDENRAFDTIIGDDMYPIFANSYLIKLG